MSTLTNGRYLESKAQQFTPGWPLRNRHVQSLLASSKLRKPKLLKRAEHLIAGEKEVLLSGGGYVRLHSFVSLHSSMESEGKSERPLVILIHGWEGSAESIYLLSAAATLFNAGFDVVRLHLRDHGPSHHLNAELFHAARIDEVLNACVSVNRHYPRDKTYLVGFSLGGNFALRVAAKAQENGLHLSHAVAVSPVVNPIKTMQAIEDGWSAYRQYFVKKWQTSLGKKQRAFPDLVDSSYYEKTATLGSMTDELIKHHTTFDSVESYFNSYALIGDRLANLSVPTDIITAADDPVIPVDDFSFIRGSSALRCRVFPHGGHCGFIKDWQFNSWIDDELLRLLDH